MTTPFEDRQLTFMLIQTLDKLAAEALRKDAEIAKLTHKSRNKLRYTLPKCLT